jgi:hypothetical protein
LRLSGLRQRAIIRLNDALKQGGASLATISSFLDQAMKDYYFGYICFGPLAPMLKKVQEHRGSLVSLREEPVLSPKALAKANKHYSLAIRGVEEIIRSLEALSPGYKDFWINTELKSKGEGWTLNKIKSNLASLKGEINRKAK